MNLTSRTVRVLAEKFRREPSIGMPERFDIVVAGAGHNSQFEFSAAIFAEPDG